MAMLCGMAARRKHSPHPGVVLIPPKGRYTSYRVRYTDPQTQKVVWVTINSVVCTTAEQRKLWCIAKSKQLANLKTQIELGIAPESAMELSKAVEAYHERAGNRLREGTRELYKKATDKFLVWAEEVGLKTTNQLTAPKLPLFRDSLLAEQVAPATINSRLRAVKTMLNDLRIRGVVGLTSDAIADNLKNVPQNVEVPEFLTIAEIQQLLQACAEHDAAMVLYRDGTSLPRYSAITPLVRFCLLTGVRIGEALSLEWSEVDLTGTGTVRIVADKAKTAMGRMIALDICPSVHELLTHMPRTTTSVFNTNKTAIEAAKWRLTGARPEYVAKGVKRFRVPLVVDYGAPKRFTWQLLRGTCATYLCNAPSIFGAASAWSSAKRLGHSVQVAERHYAGLLSVSADARTIEQAMGI